MSLPSKPHKIKVCLVAISLGEGGADRACALLSQMLDAQGFEVHIAILTNKISFPYKGKLFNLGALKLEKDSFLRRFLRLRKLKKYLKKEGITYVIDHRPKNHLKRELFYANYVYKKRKTIYVVHSYKLETYFGYDPEQFKKVYAGNHATVAVSEGIKTRLDKELQLPNLQVIQNPFDPGWLEKSKENVELPQGHYILSYGRLDDGVKDFSFLIESYHDSRLWEEGYRLVIMGEGKDEQKLKNKVKELSLDEHVDLLPFTSNPFPFIAHAKATCLSSRWEGFPMVLIESLALGIPVVSLDIDSGPAEIIQHKKNGLLVADRDTKQYANALREIVLDESLYNTCKNNARASIDNYSMENISKAWTKLLTNE